MKLLRSELHKAGSQKALALRVGVSPQYINDVLNGRRTPGKRIPRALGYEHVDRYEKRKVRE